MMRIITSKAAAAAAAAAGRRRGVSFFSTLPPCAAPPVMLPPTTPRRWPSSSDSASRSSSTSTSTSSTPTNPTQPPAHPNKALRSKIGIGGSKLANVNPDQYASVIATSLRCGVTTFESGHGGEQNLCNAFTAAMRHFEESGDEPMHADIVKGDGEGEEGAQMPKVTLTARFGYRTVGASHSDTAAADDAADVGDAKGDASSHHGADDVFPNDVLVENQPTATSSSSSSATTTQESSAASGDTAADEESVDAGRGDKDIGNDLHSAAQPADEGHATSGGGGVAVHNLSREYVARCLSSSPLVALCREHIMAAAQAPNVNASNVNLVYLAHNPEAQGAVLASQGAPLDDVKGLIKERLTDAFVGLETGIAENLISSYGVCSNGLSLPSSHPLHLPWEDVLEAASNAVGLVHGDDSITGILPNGRVAGLSTIQLPANLLETTGLDVAKQIKEYLASVDGDNGDEEPPLLPNLPADVNVFVTRPLTCYPDRGMGTGHPFKLVDYLIDTTTTTTSDLASPKQMSHTKVWTNQIEGARPPHYGQALSATMGHFDATSILEAGQERKLTVEERETLDGCRLLQSMIHDLDANLDTIRSFAAYEHDLYTKVVPLIHDTFEELDEDSAAVLQAFFVAHGAAVRHAIARTTRNLLKEGGDGVDPCDDIPDEVTLQEFALQFLLKNEFVDKVIVGCPRPEHVLEAVHAADHLTIASDS